MTPDIAALPKLEITASAPTGDSAAIASSVRSYADMLCRQLGFPAEVDVIVTATEPPALSIGAESLTPDADFKELDSGRLAEQLCRSIFKGRECLVTDNVARTLWREWRLEDSGWLEESFGMFKSMLRETVRLGRSVQRVRDPFSNSGAKRDRKDCESLLEDAFQHAGASNIRLYLSQSMHQQGGDAAAARDGSDVHSFSTLLNGLGDTLFYDLGIMFGIEIRPDETLEPDGFRVEWNDIALPPMRGLAPGTILVDATPDELRWRYGIGEAVAAANPASGRGIAIVPDTPEIRVRLKQEPLTIWSQLGYITLFISGEVQANAGGFFNRQLLDAYLDRLQEVFPDLVQTVLDRFERNLLSRMLRLLLEEDIMIRDLRTIFDAILTVGGTTTADGRTNIIFCPGTGFLLPSDSLRTPDQLLAQELAECARVALKRYISHKYTRGKSTLTVLLIEPAIEQRIHEWHSQEPAEEERREILDAIRSELAGLPPGDGLVILSTIEVRRPLRDLIHNALPLLPVLSYQELSPEMNIQPQGRVTLRK